MIIIIFIILLFASPVQAVEFVNGVAAEIACPMTKISDGTDLTTGTVRVKIMDTSGNCKNASDGTITCGDANDAAATYRYKNLWTLAFTPASTGDRRIMCYDTIPSTYSVSYTKTVYAQDRIIDTDNVGINWADVSNPTTAVGLSNTTVGTVTNVVTVTTNNDKTGYTASTVTDKTGYSLAADQAVNVTKWNGAAVATPDAAGYPVVTVKDGTGAGEINTSSGNVTATSPVVLQSTTIATLATQTSFTLTAGSADNTAYLGAVVVVTDSVTSTQKAVGRISAYTGATKTVTLNEDPGVFVMAAGDTIDIIVTDKTYADIAAILTDTAEIGTAGAGLTNINLPDQTMNVTGDVTGNLSGSVGSVTGLTASNLDATVGSRMATYTQPTGFLATTFPTGTVANTTNITAGTIANVTNDVGITQAGADKVWETTARTITGGTIGTYTGNTPQTGDSFARLGAPAGASVSADVAAVLARTPSATAIPNINAAYDGTGYAGQAIKVTIGTTTATWLNIPLVETGVITANDDHVGKWLWCGLLEPKKIVKTVQDVTTDTVTVAPGDPFSPAPQGLTCYIN